MALKQRMSVMVDEYLGAMNMPTRSELRTLQDRLQETRRENKAMARRLDRLEKALAAMSGDDGEAPNAIKSQASAPAAPRSTTTRKKASTRKKAAAKPAGE